MLHNHRIAENRILRRAPPLAVKHASRCTEPVPGGMTPDFRHMGARCVGRQGLRHLPAAGDRHRHQGQPHGSGHRLENAPSLGRGFGELYVTSMRPAPPATYPLPRRGDAATLQRQLESPLNGSRNIRRFDISPILREHGIHD